MLCCVCMCVCVCVCVCVRKGGGGGSSEIHGGKHLLLPAAELQGTNNILPEPVF